MIWFDLDNSPHVPLFRPVIRELEKKKQNYIITARDFAQTNDLLKLWGIKYIPVGKHAGKSKLNKVTNLFTRSSQLLRSINKAKIQLAVSHGSRTQLIAAKRAGIKSILMLDYEYTEHRIFNYFSTNLLMPKYIPESRLRKEGFNLKKIIRYNGFKEELYLNQFQPMLNFRKSLNIDSKKILVIFRPPSMVGNYHDKRSEELLLAGLNYFSKNEKVLCLIVNRTEYEKKFINEHFSGSPNIRFLEKAVDGLQLLYTADIAISGGGTMNRESALLGTPTYSIYTGRRPYLDEYLQELGKLKFIENPNDFEKIDIKPKKQQTVTFQNNLASQITDIIIDKMKSQHK